MKNLLFKTSVVIVLFVSFIAATAVAQSVPKNAAISFLGIDYSHVKLVGEMAHWGSNTLDTDEVIEKYFTGWNDLFVNEAKKYDVNKFFKTSNMTTQIGFFDDINAKTSSKNLMQKSSPEVDAEMIKTWAKKHNYTSVKSPYAIFLVATELNKGKEFGKYYIVLVDKKAKAFYVSAEQSGKPGGFGFRNYWANTFFKVLQDAKKSTKDWFE